MKTILLLTTLTALTYSSGAFAQIDVDTYSIRQLPTTFSPLPRAPVAPAGC